MDRFDLEDSITGLYSIMDIIDDIARGITSEDPLSQDEIINALNGLSIITKLKVNKAFSIFVETLKLDQCKDDFK